MKTRIWIGALVVLMISCINESKHWLEEAEACMEADPVRAYQYLQQVDSAMAELTDEQQAKYALLQVQAMHKCRLPLDNDSLIDIAVTFYQKSSEKHALAKSLLYKGLVHKQNDEVEQAVEAFAASERYFTDVEDNRHKALLFDHYGLLLLKQAMYEEALHYFKLTWKYEMMGDSAHYVVSTYRHMAMVYDLLGHKDSARTCYIEGLAYADEKKIRAKNYYHLLQNYASFLTETHNYPEAEHLLLQCADRLEDSTYVHTLNSSLATLYYKKGEYEMALSYANKTLKSRDSLTVCGGYLRLYKIYREMGDLQTAMHYHDLYREYDNDLSTRRRTAQVAAIPYRMKNRLLQQEGDIWEQRKWGWIGMSALMLVAAWGIFYFIRKREGRKQLNYIRQLDELKLALTHAEQLLSETTVNLGGLKGVVTSQTHALNRLKEEQLKAKEEYKEKVKSLKEDMRSLEAGIRKLKDESRARKQLENEQRQNLKKLSKELKTKTDKLSEMEHQHLIDRQLSRLVTGGQDSIAADMLLQLRYGEEVYARYDIHQAEYLPLLKGLLRQGAPALDDKLQNCGLERNKLTMCYLMALGLDDVEMMSRAACLAPNSVKAYHKECWEMVDSLRL